MTAHFRQPGVFTTNTARTDVPQRPTAAAYGEGAALVDGAWMYSDGSTWTSMGGSTKERNPLMAMLGDSHINFQAAKLDVASYSVTGGTLTLTMTGTISSIFTANKYCYIAGNSSVFPFIGYQFITAVGTDSIDIAGTGLPDTASTNITRGRVVAHTVDDTSTGTGAGKGYLGFVHYANVFSGNPFIIPASYGFGVTGDTYTPVPSQDKVGLITRIADNWASMPVKPNYVLFCCGANDANHLSDSVSDITWEQFKADAAACWEYVKDNGAVPLVMHVMTCANTSSFNGTYNQWAARINQFIDEYATENGTIYPIPEVAQFVADPASTTGAMRSGFSTDGIHFLSLGAHAAGRALSTVFKRLEPPRKAMPSSYLDAYSADNPTGCLRNAMNAGAARFPTTVLPVTVTATSAGTAHALADGWVVYRTNANGTVTAEIAARTDTDENGIPYPGNELIISFTGNTISDMVTVRTTNGASLHANLSVGDVVYSEIEYAWTDLVGCTVLRPPKGQMVFIENGNTRYTSSVFHNQNVRPETWSGVDRSQNFRINRIGTSPSAYPIIQMYAPTATSGKLRIRYHTIRKNLDGIPW